MDQTVSGPNSYRELNCIKKCRNNAHSWPHTFFVASVHCPVEYALREITKGKMSTKFMSMKRDYVSCDFTLLNCFVVQTTTAQKEKSERKKNAIRAQCCDIEMVTDLIVNNYKQARPRRHNITSNKNVYFFIYSSIHSSYVFECDFFLIDVYAEEEEREYIRVPFLWFGAFSIIVFPFVLLTHCFIKM